MSDNGKTSASSKPLASSTLLTVTQEVQVAYVIADLNRAVRRLEAAIMAYQKMKEEST